MSRKSQDEEFRKLFKHAHEFIVDMRKMVYMQTLIEDIKKDTTELRAKIRYMTDAIDFHQKFVKNMEKGDATFDTILSLFRSHNHGNMGVLGPFKTTFESLLSTGDIEIFNDKEIEAMMLYYDKIKLRYYLINERYLYAYEKNRELREKYGFLGKRNNDNLVYETLIENLERKEFFRLLDLAEYTFLSALIYGKRDSESLLKDTTDLLEKLNLH